MWRRWYTYYEAIIRRIAENWEQPRGGMVDTKDLKDVLTFLRIRSNIVNKVSSLYQKHFILCSANVVSYE